jgi:uncharacterized membrane protein
MILEWVQVIQTAPRQAITGMALVGLAGGLAWGVIIWRQMERQYQLSESGRSAGNAGGSDNVA